MARTTHAIAGGRAIGSALRVHFGFKLASVLVFGSVFFGGYFLLLKFPFFVVTEMPVTALDRLIAFRPGVLWLYVSLWIYVPLVPGLANGKDGVMAFYRTAAGLCLVGFAFFFFWPTAVPALNLDWTGQSTFARLKAVDGSGNACPSLHVAFAVFCAGLLYRRLRQMGVNVLVGALSWVWCAGIVYSTLATKQHVVLDAAAGAALGAAGAAIHLRRHPADRAKHP